MSLQQKIEKIKFPIGLIRFCGCLKQLGTGGAILNADLNGEQKTTDNLAGETVPKISTECLTNGVFKHRIYNIPINALNDLKKKSSLDDVKKLFEAIIHNRIEFRGGAVMTDGTMNAEKSFRVDEAIPFNNNKDYFTVENRRLGIKGDDGKNDYPRQQILYKNLKFFFSSYLDLSSFNINNNKILKAFIGKVDLLGTTKEELEFKEEVSYWLDKTYPTKNDELDLEKVISQLKDEIYTYEHPVHQRFNSFLLMTDITVENLLTREELEKSLEKTKHHHGV